jgi:uncharacterized protein YggU (UPF0235/DUF167 family)
MVAAGADAAVLIRFTPTPAGLSLLVRLTPNASVDRIEGWETGADGQVYLKARVRAVPEKGAANAALIKLLAKQAGLAKTRLALIRGTTHRLKTIEIACDDGERQALTKTLGALGA